MRSTCFYILMGFPARRWIVQICLCWYRRFAGLAHFSSTADTVVEESSWITWCPGRTWSRTDGSGHFRWRCHSWMLLNVSSEYSTLSNYVEFSSYQPFVHLLATSCTQVQPHRENYDMSAESNVSWISIPHLSWLPFPCLWNQTIFAWEHCLTVGPN